MKKLYDLVSPENFTEEQKKFVESVKASFKTGFSPSMLMPEVRCSIKDIHSRHIIAKDYDAKLNGLSRGEDFIGLLDCEVPCKAAEFAQDFVNEDKKLLSYHDGQKTSSMLTILEYAIGVTPLFTSKQPLTHEPSHSILGIMYVSYKVNLSYFLTLLPNYLREFGTNGNVESIEDGSEIAGISLTEYEHEVAFLMTMNWGYPLITQFMNKYRPIATERTIDAIYKCRNRICDKFDCELWDLRDKLISIGLHRKMPRSFFNRVIGLGNTPIPS